MSSDIFYANLIPLCGGKKNHEDPANKIGIYYIEELCTFPSFTVSRKRPEEQPYLSAEGRGGESSISICCRRCRFLPLPPPPYAFSWAAQRIRLIVLGKGGRAKAGIGGGGGVKQRGRKEREGGGSPPKDGHYFLGGDSVGHAPAAPDDRPKRK